VSANDIDAGTSRAMESPPDARSDGADDLGGFEEESNEERKD
jgi:hypothetical protein